MAQTGKGIAFITSNVGNCRVALPSCDRLAKSALILAMLAKSVLMNSPFRIHSKLLKSGPVGWPVP